MADVDSAFHHIHSMTGGEGFRQRDMDAARTFGAAAKAARVERMIHLDGLGESDAEMSTHLRSRSETGEALEQAGVPVTEFRALSRIPAYAAMTKAATE